MKFPKWLQRAWPGAASGILIGLGFPPFGFGLAIFVALVPWLIQLRDSDLKSSWKIGYGLGLWYGLSQMFWALLFVHRWTESFLLSGIPYLITSALFALYFGLAAIAIGKCYRGDKAWAIPAVWAGMEVLRSYVPALAFPWSLLAAPLGRYPELIQGAWFGTVFSLTAVVVAVNVLAAEVFGKPRGKAWMWMLVWIAAYAGLTAIRTVMPKPDAVTRRIGFVQPGEDLAFGNPETEPARLAMRFNRLLPLARDEKPDLLVMPEGLVRVPFMPPAPPFGVAEGDQILFGGQRGTGPTYQSSFLWNGTTWQYSDKTRLVIFGEYVPFRDLLPKGFNLPSGDLQPAKGDVKQMKGKVGVIGPVLCFEALFPDIPYRHAVAGSNLIAVMSLDDWFIGTPAIEQLRTASVWRAVETGLPVVRVGSLGTSLLIDRNGKLIDEAPLIQPAAVVREMDIPSERTVFLGLPTFPILALVLFAWSLLFRIPHAKLGQKRSSPK